MSEYQVRLPRPHSKQREFVESTAKRRVIVAGRRGGKTTGCAILAVEAALDGRKVLEAAPTAEQTGAFWDCVTDYLAEPIAGGVAYKHETKRLIELPNGGIIRCKTAHNADTLRGDYADLLILDEFQLMNPDAWNKVGAPMLLDNNGDAVFIGTPQRRNHFFKHYLMAQEKQGRWDAWLFTSLDNPHLSQEALSEITEDMTDDDYRQEILAEFLEDEGVVFRNVKGELQASRPQEHKGHSIFFGIDWGQQQDYTVVTGICRNCKEQVFIDRFKEYDYPYQRRVIWEHHKRWKPAGVMPERNSMGEPITQELIREGMNILPGPDKRPGFQTTSSTKPPLIEDLKLALEKEDLKLIDNSTLLSELLAYERKTSPSGKPSYSAPEGIHDDCVMALALAWNASLTGGFGLYSL